MDLEARELAENFDLERLSPEFYADPYPTYRALRDLGPAVSMPMYDVIALARFKEVSEALTDWETFSSAQGVGFNEPLNEAWNGTLIASDTPYHDILRSVLAERLAPRSLKNLRGEIEQRATDHVVRLVERDEFDAISELARAIPVSIVLDLLGFPMEGRDQLLEWAENSFNALGPLGKQRTLDALPIMGEMFGWLAETCTRERMIPGGFATTIHEAAARGDIPEEAVVRLMAGYSVPAMDTTIHAIGSAIELFAKNPDQWDLVRADRSLIPTAFNEVIRLESPVHIFARVATKDHELDGVTIPAGSRVAIIYASANRDERRFENPEVFDVRRENSDHVAFGLGVHSCPGQGLARMEALEVIRALADRVERFEIIGHPRRKLSNHNRGLDSLPIRVHRS